MEFAIVGINKPVTLRVCYTNGSSLVLNPQEYNGYQMKDNCIVLYINKHTTKVIPLNNVLSIDFVEVES